MIRQFLSTAGFCLAAIVGCQSAPPAAAPAPKERYTHPESFVVMVDTAEWPRPSKHNASMAPEYPYGARIHYENARVIAAVIIDSAGRVEFSSVTLLSPPDKEFDESVCAYLARARFDFVGRPRRSLVLMPFDFTVEGAGPLQPAPNYNDLAGQLNEIPRPELVERLEHERHCS